MNVNLEFDIFHLYIKVLQDLELLQGLSDVSLYGIVNIYPIKNSLAELMALIQKLIV